MSAEVAGCWCGHRLDTGWCGRRCLAGEVALVWCCDANWEVSGIPVGSAGVAGTGWRREGDPSVDPSAGGGPVGGPGRLRPSAGAGTRAAETVGGCLGVVAFEAIKLSSLKGLGGFSALNDRPIGVAGLSARPIFQSEAHLNSDKKLEPRGYSCQQAHGRVGHNTVKSNPAGALA